METENKVEITEEQMQVYDRQRFIGMEVQKRYNLFAHLSSWYSAIYVYVMISPL